MPLVAEGNGPEDALMGAVELEGDGLAHAKRSVRLDLQGHREPLDGEGSRLRFGAGDERPEQYQDDQPLPRTH
jgi:hypothetical protein